MAEISADLVYEVLKSVQHDISQIKGEIGEMKHSMQAFRLEMIGVHTQLSDIHATLGRYEHRPDRIESRLELNEAPRS